MDQNVKAEFKQSLIRCLAILRPLIGQFEEAHLIWRKERDGQWRGENQARPCLRNAFIAGRPKLEEASADFAKLFSARHPEHAGMVGSPRFGTMNLGHDPSYIVCCALSELWSRHGTFDVPEPAVDAFAGEFEKFIESHTIRFRFQAQLLNFQMRQDRLALTKDLTIRRLVGEEVSAFHGGPLEKIGYFRPRGVGIHEFVIEGEGEEPKVLGGEVPEPAGVDRVRNLLDKAMLCLRTFKEGKVGCDHVHFRAIEFCPLPLSSFWYGDLHIPLGNYALSDDQLEPLAKYAELLFSTSEPAMEMACSRLSDAEIRLRTPDRIVDAVIGLEALLLAGLAKEDRKGELKYRFSLHYSTLFSSPEERHREFRIAKDLYDLRSTIAHGGLLDGRTVRLGEEKVSLDEAGKRATNVLRTVIHHFLPHVKKAPYKRHEFWDRAYFGLPE